MSLMHQSARAPYRANMNQGDPGLFGNIFKKALGFGAKTALGLTGFGGVAAAAGGAALAASGRKRPIMTGPASRAGPPQEVRKPGVRGAIERFLPGGETGYMECPSGHRPNKTSYFLADGTFVEAGSRCVKKRQRNPMNPRALSRAIGRIDAGKRFQNRMADISTGKYTASGKRKACNGNGR